MAAPDRSWTVAPTLLWFVGSVVVLLIIFDGNLDAIANRFASRPAGDRPEAAAAGPAFTARPAAVAEADDNTDDDADADHAGSGGGGGSGSGSAAAGAPAHSAADDALDDTCTDGAADAAACKHHALDGFYRAVAASRAGTLGRALRVSWYGDSVVANDQIPGRLRTRLQQTLGDGGPGYVYVVPPHRFNEHERISRSQAGAWTTHAISTMIVADGFYGPGGSTTETDGGKSTIKLTNGAKVTHVDLYYLAQPGGGAVTVTADGADLVRADTKAETKQAGFAAGSAAAGAGTFAITTDGRVRMFGLDLENGSGAVVDNLGVVNVNVKSFQQNEPAHFVAELAHRDADLVLIMIGANEAQWLGPGDQDTKLYAGNYEKVLAPFRKARPDASCLVVSPTDQASEQDGAYPSKPVMPILVEAQRQAAHAQGCAFFSTYDWMGGKGSAATWFKKGLVGSDFQHLSRKGANKLGDAVYDALIHGAARHAAP
jgi:lysophospholipase L1-like esterase